jgi:2-(1,2-epoxy-1,2-dihydrophenyl)acetyl-CoA isomerase
VEYPAVPDFKTILIQQDGGVLTITLNRPKANALNGLVAEELMEVLKKAAKDNSIRSLVLTGANRFFSAGQDLSDLATLHKPDGMTSLRDHLRRTYNRVVLQMRKLEKPILGAINGPVAGAAMGIVLSTDLRIAAESARFIFAFTNIGLAADSGVSILLPMLVGLTKATEIAFLEQPLSARQALAYGLINRVVADDELDAAAADQAATLAAGPTKAIGLTKRAFNRALLPSLEGVLDYEAYLQEIATHSDDHSEGLSAFFEKRSPQFRGT